MVHVPFGGGQAALTAVLSNIGRHAFRQLVRSDRAVAKRHCEGAGGLDQGAYAATSECADGGRDGARLRVRGVERLCRAGRHPGARWLRGLPRPLKTIAKDPEVIKIFTNLGIDSVGTSQEEALASIRKDLPIYAQIVDQAGVRRK